jgi:hypothetical protein
MAIRAVSFLQQLGKEYSFSVSRMKLKSILDKIIKESPVARFWMISNNRSAGSLALIVNARFEYAPEDRYLEGKSFGDPLKLWP